MAKKTIFIHIGSHKTATTYLQQTMRNNPYRLLRYGAIYPQFENIWLFNDKLYRPNYINGGVIAEKKYHPLLADTLENFEKSNNNKTIVFSEEELYMYDPEGILSVIETYKRDFDIKIIFYLREINSWIISMWSYYVSNTNWINTSITETMREVSKYRANPQQYLKRRTRELSPIGNPYYYFFAYYNFLDTYKALSHAVGADNIKATPFQENFLHNKKIRDDFFEHIGVKEGMWDMEHVDRNVSPSLTQSEKFISMCKYSGDEVARKEMLKIILREQHPNDLNFLSKEEIDIIYENYYEYTCEITKTLFSKKSEADIFKKNFKYWYKYSDLVSGGRHISNNQQLSLIEKILRELSEEAIRERAENAKEREILAHEKQNLTQEINLLKRETEFLTRQNVMLDRDLSELKVKYRFFSPSYYLPLSKLPLRIIKAIQRILHK